MNKARLRDLPAEALRHLAAEFHALASLSSARPACGFGAWMLWLVTSERERRRGNYDIGLPPKIVSFDDLYEAELTVLRDGFNETALFADWHGEDVFAAWLRNFVGSFDAELERHEQAKRDLQAVVDDYRRRHPHGEPGDTSRHPKRRDISIQRAAPDANPRGHSLLGRVCLRAYGRSHRSNARRRTRHEEPLTGSPHGAGKVAETGAGAG